MNIFIREMKAHRKSLIIWCIGMIFMVVSGMGKFSAYSSTGQSINDIIAKIPKSVRIIITTNTRLLNNPHKNNKSSNIIMRTGLI